MYQNGISAVQASSLELSGRLFTHLKENVANRTDGLIEEDVLEVMEARIDCPLH